MDYNKNICYKSNMHEESYTGEYIREWCLYHINNDTRDYNYIAFEVYDNYFSDYCKIKANLYSYYFMEYNEAKFMNILPIKLIRDECKSPRKKFA